MESVAATPVVSPASAISLLSCSAMVKPARAPVISTRASFRPSTMALDIPVATLVQRI